MKERPSLREAASACAAYLHEMVTAYPDRFPRAQTLRAQLIDALAVVEASEPFGAAIKYCSSAEHTGPRVLPLEDFSRSKGSPDGRQAYCKQCMADYGRRWSRKYDDAIQTE